MAGIDKIVKEIKEMAENGDLDENNIVKIKNRSENKAIMLKASYAGNRDFDVKSEVVVNADKDYRKKEYNLYIKYVGVKNDK